MGSLSMEVRTEALCGRICDLEAENAKLRELVQDMLRYYFMPSAIDNKQRETELLERAYELGIEKDNGEMGVEVDA